MHIQLKPAGLALVLAILILSTNPTIVNAQTNMYLQVAGVVGSSGSPTHAGWSVVTRFEFGIEAPTPLVKTPNIHGLKIVKPVDSASVPFMEAAASAMVYPNVILDVFRTGIAGIDERLLYFEMSSVRIVSYSVEGDLTKQLEPATETIELQFDEITVTHPVIGPGKQVINNLQFSRKTSEYR